MPDDIEPMQELCPHWSQAIENPLTIIGHRSLTYQSILEGKEMGDCSHCVVSTSLLTDEHV